jgi:hypothetical protein
MYIIHKERVSRSERGQKFQWNYRTQGTGILGNQAKKVLVIKSQIITKKTQFIKGCNGHYNSNDTLKKISFHSLWLDNLNHHTRNHP